MYYKKNESRQTSLKIFKLYMMFVLIVELISPLRTYHVLNTAVYYKYVLAIIISLIFFCIIYYQKRVFFLDFFAKLMIFLILQTAVVGLFYQHELYYFFSDIIAPSFSLVVYIFANTFNLNPSKLQITLEKLSLFALWIGVIVIFFDYFYGMYTGIGSYLSYGSCILLFPLSYYLLYGPNALVLATLLAIFMGAKVGVIFSAGFLIFIALVVKKRVKFSRTSLITLFIVITVLGNFTLYFVKDYEVEGSSIISPVLNKIQQYNYFHYQKFNDSFDTYGSGRFAEVHASLDQFSLLSAWSYIYGSGAGFVYGGSDAYYGGDTQQNYTHNVHISPITIIQRYGIIMGCIFYLAWLSLLYKNYQFSVQQIFFNNRVPAVMLCYCIGMFFFSFSAFSIFVDLTTWFFLGFTNRLRQDSFVA